MKAIIFKLLPFITVLYAFIWYQIDYMSNHQIKHVVQVCNVSRDAVCLEIKQK